MTMSLRGLLKKLWEESASDVIPTLDLHGLSVKEALEETRNFVEISYREGLTAVRIVYGKGLGSPGGKGILREVIPAWCEKEGKSRVARFQREVDLKGGDGSLIVFLKSLPRPEGAGGKDYK
jgi:DNA-nicking Smr family endonuclease